MDITKIVTNIFRVLFIVILLFIIYQLVRVIYGGTWEAENIIIAGMGIILTGVFVVAGFLINQGKSLGALEERTKNIGDSLLRLGVDFKHHIERHKK